MQQDTVQRAQDHALLSVLAASDGITVEELQDQFFKAWRTGHRNAPVSSMPSNQDFFDTFDRIKKRRWLHGALIRRNDAENIVLWQLNAEYRRHFEEACAQQDRPCVQDS